MTTIVQGEILYHLVAAICKADIEAEKKQLLKKEILELIQSAIVDINACSQTGVTPVSIACFCNALETVDFQMALGANINQRIKTAVGSYTVLEVGLSMKHLPLAKYLIERHQADVDSYKDGNSALSIAWSIPESDIEFIKCLVSRMRNLDESVIGSALLHLASIGGSTDIARYLLSLRPINLNCPYPSSYGKHYLLALAVRKINVSLIRLLCENGASGDVKYKFRY